MVHTLNCERALTRYSVRLRLGFSTWHSTQISGLMFWAGAGRWCDAMRRGVVGMGQRDASNLSRRRRRTGHGSHG